uniref:Ig-like domain-containing protein n=1 Tax=Xiphophorus couchianus TaxID=32473 RepID=A0A3B5LV74_9TELE
TLCYSDLVMYNVILLVQIKAAPGEDVIFQCSVSTEWDVSMSVEWTRPDLRHDSDKKYVLVYKSQDVDKSLTMESYIGRVFLFPEELQNGNVSLKITNVTVNDSGKYKCFLRSLWKSVIFTLIVKIAFQLYMYNYLIFFLFSVEWYWWFILAVAAAAVVVVIVIGGNYLFIKCVSQTAVKPIAFCFHRPDVHIDDKPLFHL